MGLKTIDVSLVWEFVGRGIMFLSKTLVMLL